MRKLSVRGEQVDFARFLAEEGERPALGNAKMNARGDQIDVYGNVVKTRAEISAEYHRSHTKSVKQVSIKSMNAETFTSPAQALQDLNTKVKNAERFKAAAAEEKFGIKSRRISDSE